MHRSYTKDFKVKACELVLKDSCKCAEVAERFGINKIMLYRWIDEYNTYGDDAFVGHGYLHSEKAKIRKLQKKLEELRTENEILKNAAAYFAKHPAEN